MNKIILVDLDHTISDAFHRDEMIGVAPWDEYHARLVEDDPAHDFVEFLNNSALHEMYGVIGLTSRPEKFRGITMKWLVQHGVKLDDIWMRQNHDYRAAHDLKIAICQEKLGEDWKSHILFIIDDNEKVISAFRGAGISCMQIYNRRGRK
jgi:hypothetical protein